VYLKVSPIRGLRRFKIKGKLSPRYIGPFNILEQKGEVAHQLELPALLSDVDNMCGRTNLNYTGSSTRVHSKGLQRASNGIIPWPVGQHPDKPPIHRIK
jgi:hypothetical protein